MKGYITAVAAVAIMAALADVLIPKGWQKYISILTGAIVLITLTSPLIRFRGISPPTFSVPDISYRKYSVEDEVEYELKKRIEEDISARLEDEFNIKAISEVKLSVSDGKITGVKEITVFAKENATAAARLSEIYGLNKIIWRQQ